MSSGEIAAGRLISSVLDWTLDKTRNQSQRALLGSLQSSQLKCGGFVVYYRGIRAVRPSYHRRDRRLRGHRRFCFARLLLSWKSP